MKARQNLAKRWRQAAADGRDDEVRRLTQRMSAKTIARLMKSVGGEKLT